MVHHTVSALLVIAVSRATAAGGRAARWALIVALALGIACSGQKRSAKEKPARTAKTDAAHGKPDRERRTPALSRDAHEDVVISLDDDARDVQVEKAELYTRLRSLFLANNIGQIERELKAAEKKYPLRDDRDYHYYWGVVQERAGKLDDAVKSYARAIELSPNYSRARNALGKLYCRLKRYPEARVQYLLALEANPYNPFINYNLGSLYFEFNHLDVALKYLNNAAEYKKNFGSAYHKIGIIMYRKGQYQNAVINLSMAITFNKASHITFYYLGMSQFALGKHAEAVTSLTKSLGMKSDFFESAYELGKVNQLMGRYADALGYYRRAQRLRPDVSDINILIVDCLAELKRYSEAIKILREIVDKNPKNKLLAEKLKHLQERESIGNLTEPEDYYVY